MLGEDVTRWQVALLLAPALLVIVVLFGGGLGYGVLQSLGYQPLTGSTQLSLDAYQRLLFGERHAQQVWAGLWFTIWISAASTVLSAGLALMLALSIRATTWGQRLASFLFQFNLTVPHLVAAIGTLFVLSQSGLIARLAAAGGLISSPADFPILVRSEWGIGIIIAYLWKETPFIGVIVLAVLQSLGDDYENAARTLGANRWQRFRYVTLPMIRPALLSASVIVFAFTFGAYQVPEILGVRYPQALPVLALDFFTNADLNARAEAMALSVLISLVTMALVVVYLWLRDRPS